MLEVHCVIDCLEKTPVILSSLLSQIPRDLFRIRRIKGKWSIHEQICHLAEAQDVLISRFKQFDIEQNPLIRVYEPPADRPETHYSDMDMDSELARLTDNRSEMITMLRGYPEEYWGRQGRHAAFAPYNTRLLLTHSLNVDYVHLFSIEQLGLTKPGLEDQILTIP